MINCFFYPQKLNTYSFYKNKQCLLITFSLIFVTMVAKEPDPTITLFFLINLPSETILSYKCDSILKVCKIAIYYCFGNIPILSKSLPITPMVLNYK